MDSYIIEKSPSLELLIDSIHKGKTIKFVASSLNEKRDIELLIENISIQKDITTIIGIVVDPEKAKPDKFIGSLNLNGGGVLATI